MAGCQRYEPLPIRCRQGSRSNQQGFGAALDDRRECAVELAFAVLPLGRHLDTVVGWDDTERHKPHPDPLLVALARLGVEPAAAAYVGDSPFDVGAAKAAGVFAVAADWGGIHSRERLAAEEPDALVSHPEQLLGLL